MSTPTTGIDVRQAAQRANVSDRTIRRYVRAGILTCYRYKDRKIVFDPADVDRIAKPNRKAKGADAPCQQ